MFHVLGFIDAQMISTSWLVSMQVFSKLFLTSAPSEKRSHKLLNQSAQFVEVRKLFFEQQIIKSDLFPYPFLSPFFATWL